MQQAFIYFATYSDWALLALRLAFGALMVVHGWPKLRNLKQTAEQFGQMGFKPGSLFGTLAALLEFFGGITIILGFLIQPVAILFALQFLVIIIWRISKKNPFAHGWELDLLILAVALIMLSIGAGSYSLDRYLFSGGL